MWVGKKSKSIGHVFLVTEPKVWTNQHTTIIALYSGSLLITSITFAYCIYQNIGNAQRATCRGYQLSVGINEPSSIASTTIAEDCLSLLWVCFVIGVFQIIQNMLLPNFIVFRWQANKVDLISIYKSLYKCLICQEKYIWFDLDASGLDLYLKSVSNDFDLT